MPSRALQADEKQNFVIGAGAAGMACAATLVKHTDRFNVIILERNAFVGGQATSINLDEDRYGAAWMNNGVQGGSSVHRGLAHTIKAPAAHLLMRSQIFKHTFNFFNQYGFPARKVQLQVSFGKGSSAFWTNVFPSKLVEKHSSDIKKFGTFLKVIKWNLPILRLVPISIMLRIFFFRTGNQTAHVPSAIVERLFDDPNMKLWDYDPVTLLPNLPTMYTFDNLDRFYRTWSQDLKTKGVKIRTSTEVTGLISRSDVGVRLLVRDIPNGSSAEETFDDMVLCVLADDALQLLGDQATWREKVVLGGARFYDVTITHSDKEYFEKHYETRFENLCAEPQSESQEQITLAKGDNIDRGSGVSGFRPMYFKSSYKQDPRLIEMSFNCSNYQHQLKQAHSLNDRTFDPIYQS